MTPNPPPTAETIETIMVVDDEILVRMPIAEYLRSCGYKVIEAVSTAEAMTVLDADIAIDVVLISAETEEGFALAKWIRGHRKQLKIILVGGPVRAAEAAAALCDDGPLLARPYEPKVVLDRIRALLADKSKMHSQTAFRPSHPDNTGRGVRLDSSVDKGP